MENLRVIFRSPAFHLFLFGVFSALLGWPLLTLADQGRGAVVFWYLVAVWCLAILLLSRVSRSLKESKDGGARPGRGGEGPADG